MTEKKFRVLTSFDFYQILLSMNSSTLLLNKTHNDDRKP